MKLRAVAGNSYIGFFLIYLILDKVEVENRVTHLYRYVSKRMDIGKMVDLPRMKIRRV